MDDIIKEGHVCKYEPVHLGEDMIYQCECGLYLSHDEYWEAKCTESIDGYLK